MQPAFRNAVIVAGAGLVSACTGDTAGPTAAQHSRIPAAAAAAAAAAADLSGGWTFAREVKITAPPWVAELVFGVEPEGSVTHIRCADTGSMTLEPDGTGFSGMAWRLEGTCETAGGQVFPMAPSLIQIADGSVRGRSAHFDWVEDGYLRCPYHAVLSGGGLEHLAGTGRCIVPGHPQSPVPANPPPAGTSKTVSFSAWRS
jgi:hypothetical protein